MAGDGRMCTVLEHASRALVSPPRPSVIVATTGFDCHGPYLWGEACGSFWLKSGQRFGRRWSHSYWGSNIRGVCPRIGSIVAHRRRIVASTVAGSDRHGVQGWLCHGIKVRRMTPGVLLVDISRGRCFHGTP